MASLSQSAKSAPSSEQAKVAPSSFEVNEKLALATLVEPGGADVIEVSGGVVSTVHSNAAALGSALPAGSVATTAKECGPSSRPVYAVYARAGRERASVERALEARAVLGRGER